MAQKKTTRQNRRKRSALRPASSPQADSSAVAGPGKAPASSVPEGTRFFDRFSRRDAPAALALGLLTGICYLPAMLWGGLIWDDFIWFQSRAVREWSGLGAIWSWPSLIENESHYWPLTYTTFWLEHKIWGLEPSGYHAVNVLLHLLNSLLAWRLLVRLAVPGAWVAAAVFAAHPLHVESVAWIIERKDVLSGLFYLAAVLVWLRFLQRPRPWRYGLALLLFAAGLLSKSIVITLPVALLIVQWWKSGRITGRDLQRLAPFFLVALVITALDLSSYGSRHGALDYSLPERVLIASRALWFYAGKLAWPTDLAVVYPRWDISLGDPWAWVYLAAAAALATALWLLRHRIGRGPLAGALFFAVTLSPVLGFVKYGYMDHSFVADRMQYLAGIGVMAVVIGAAAHSANRMSGRLKMGAAGVVVAVLALLGTTTWRQAGIYRDDVTFYSHIISLNPKAWIIHSNLGKALIRADRPEEALAAARINMKKNPDHAGAFSLLGHAFFLAGRFDEAEENLRRALEIDPSHRATHLIMVDMLRKQERYEEAREGVRAVLEIDSESALAHAYMGEILLHLHRYNEAVESLNKALSLSKDAPSLKPDLPAADSLHVLLGKASSELGRPQAAAEHFQRALAINPRNRQSLNQLGEYFFEQKHYQEALDLYQALLEIDPDNAATHSNIATTLSQLGRPEAVEEHIRRALELDPLNTEALKYLAASRFGRKRYQEALDLYRTLLEIDPDNGTTHTNIGVTLHYLGRTQEAIRSLERALSLDPTLETARTNLDNIRKTLRKPEK